MATGVAVALRAVGAVGVAVISGIVGVAVISVIVGVAGIAELVQATNSSKIRNISKLTRPLFKAFSI